MFENPVMTDKPITVVLTTNMTHAIQSYLVSRKPDSCVQFDFMTGRELDIFHKDDNKQELRREWQDKLKETLDIPVKTPLQFYDVVTTNLDFAYLIKEIKKAIIEGNDEDYNDYLTDWSKNNKAKGQ